MLCAALFLLPVEAYKLVTAEVMERKNQKEERILAAVRQNVELTARLIGRAVRGMTLYQRVAAVLDVTPGGSALDRYFGISSGKPEQPPCDARRSERLASMLNNTDDTVAYSRLALRLRETGAPRGLDQDALRALMYRRVKPDTLN